MCTGLQQCAREREDRACNSVTHCNSVTRPKNSFWRPMWACPCVALYLPLCCLVFAPVLAKTFASDLQSLTQIRISHCHTPLATLANSTVLKCATSVSCADIFTLAPRAFPTQHLPLFLRSLFNSILCICFNKESTLRPLLGDSNDWNRIWATFKPEWTIWNHQHGTYFYRTSLHYLLKI